MQPLIDILTKFYRSLQFWVTVAPWEQALSVRLGKHVRLLQPGPHLKIPFVDQVFVQSVRLRISSSGKQTLTMADGVTTVTLSAALSYSIADIEILYRSVHHIEDTLQQMARGIIAQYVAIHEVAGCTPALIESAATERLALARYGIGDAQVIITEFAIARTYRLIGDVTYGMHGRALNTEAVDR
jgi:hypothetical protein